MARRCYSPDGEPVKGKSVLLNFLRRPIETPSSGDAGQLGENLGFDPVTSRMHRPRIEAEPCDDRRVRIVAVVRLAEQHGEEIGAPALDLLEQRFAPARVERHDPAGGPRGIFQRAKSFAQQRVELLRLAGGREDVLERDSTGRGKPLLGRDQGVEH